MIVINDPGGRRRIVRKQPTSKRDPVLPDRAAR
jgi:hypothetical protein